MYCKYLHIIVFLVLHLTHLTGFFSTNKQNNKLVRDWILSQILCVTSVGYWCGQVRVSGDCRHQQQGLQSGQPTGIMRSLKKGTMSRDFRHFLVINKTLPGLRMNVFAMIFAKICENVCLRSHWLRLHDVSVVLDYADNVNVSMLLLTTLTPCQHSCWLHEHHVNIVVDYGGHRVTIVVDYADMWQCSHWLRGQLA